MQIALIGWQSSGKSTLFSAVSGSAPAHGEEAHPGVALVPDQTLDRLFDLFPRTKKVNARVDYLDVVGLAPGQKRSGIKRALVNHLQGATVLAPVIGVFQHGPRDACELVEDARRQLDDLEIEMLLSDLATAEPRLAKIEAQKQRGQEIDEFERQALRRCIEWLDEERPLRTLALTGEEEKAIRGHGLLTRKPLLVTINHGEDQDGATIRARAREQLAAEQRRVIVLNAALEAEIAALDEEDRELFVTEMGIETPAADKLIRAGFDLLGLIRFFTIGDDEVRAWPIAEGADAVAAAGTIHSDLARGFIRAEVVHADDLIRLGSLSACREQGLLRLEGKTYRVADGDLLYIRFAV
ncbi:MAG: Ribosome-binding ATPase YchF [Calditrichaeota bacterium]|nr:Ribosome-binding ATPase YchF [Calditrichota bacterium]